LDGDKLKENEVTNTIRSDRFFQKIEDDNREKLKAMYSTNTLYLPSELPPETLFYNYLQNEEPFRKLFTENYNLNSQEFKDICDRLKDITNHHRYYQEVAKILQEDENKIIADSIKLLIKSDSTIETYCKDFAEKLKVLIESDI